MYSCSTFSRSECGVEARSQTFQILLDILNQNQVKQDGKEIKNTSQKSPHPEITSLPVSDLYNVEKIEVGPSGDNSSNPDINILTFGKPV
jgi:hypothetical protein